MKTKTTGTSAQDREEERDISLLEPEERPKVNALLEEMGTAMTHAGDCMLRQQAAWQTRNCVWNGQSPNGRKEKKYLGKKALPFEGASDVRAWVAEEIITESVLVKLSALYRGKTSFVPREASDVDKARLMGLIMNYYLGGAMKTEIRNVMALVADWTSAYGFAIVGAGWQESCRLGKKSVTAAALLEWALMKGAEELQQRSADFQSAPVDGEAQPDGADWKSAVLMEQLAERVLFALTDTSKGGRALLTELLLQYDPEMLHPERAARALHHEELAEYYVKEIVDSRPAWRARQPFVDIFFPPWSMDSIQNAPWMVEVEWLTAVQVRAVAKEEGWDEAWTEKVLKQPGWAFNFTEPSVPWALQCGGIGLCIPGDYRDSKLFQICRMFYKASTAEGITGVWQTVVHQAVPDSFGMHRLMDDLNGNYPFVMFRREIKERLLLASRGIAEVTSTDQLHLKAQLDGQTDALMLQMRPPIIKPSSMTATDHAMEVKPGGQLIEMREGTVRFMPVPEGGQQASIPIMEAHWGRLARRFGMMHEKVPPTLTQMHMEVMVGDFFTDLTELLRMTVSLVQRYMPVLTGVRVGGGEEAFAAAGRPEILEASRDEIQGMFDVDVQFDVRDLDLEWLKEKLSLLVELAIPLDSMAVIDRGMIVRMILSAIEPRLAMAANSSEAAALSEEQDELTQLAIIVAGEEPPFVEDGQNHALRLQVLQRALQRSPRLDSIVREDKQVALVLEARMKMHQQQVTQEENKIIGRMGAAQVLGGGAG